MNIFGVLTMIGGLAMFLYGMNAMGDGLAKLSGGKLEQILEKLTSKRIMAVLLGVVVTAIIQSSSATTVMVVGFVNSGIMQLSQAVGIIMGANIGTTVTSWLLSLTGIQGSSLFIQLLKPSSCGATGRKCTVYQYSYKVFQSGTWYAGGAGSYSSHSELFRIGWYFAGIVRDRCCRIQDRNSNYYGTEYRNVCDSNYLIDRCQ